MAALLTFLLILVLGTGWSDPAAAQSLSTDNDLLESVDEPYTPEIARLIERAFGESLAAEAEFSGTSVEELRRTSVYVFTADLDEPGTHPQDEVITIHSSTTVCGFGGACAVIFKSLGNLWYEIYSVNAAALPLRTYTNGMRDLLLSGPGEVAPVWTFDGVAYRFARSETIENVSQVLLDLERKRPRIAEAEIDLVEAADGPALLGPCIDGSQWAALAIVQGDRSGGSATYSACGEPDPTLAITCWPDEDTLAMRAPVEITTSGDGDPIEVVLAVGSRIYRFDGTAIYNAGIKIVEPRWTVPKTSPAIASLRNGRIASVRAGGATVTMHLTGSSRVLGAMRDSCAG